MFHDNFYDVEQLSSDDRTLIAQKYRGYLCRIARAAIWTTYIYFAVRLFFILITPDRTWKMWTMLGVEGLFGRKLSSNKEHRATADPVRHIPERPTPVLSRNNKAPTSETPQKTTQQ